MAVIKVGSAKSSEKFLPKDNVAGECRDPVAGPGPHRRPVVLERNGEHAIRHGTADAGLPSLVTGADADHRHRRGDEGRDARYPAPWPTTSPCGPMPD